MKYFHGTPILRSIGDILIPGNVIGEGDHLEDVYLTIDISLAAQYATWDGEVYEVEPIGEVVDDFTDNGIAYTFTCKSAKVIGVVW